MQYLQQYDKNGIQAKKSLGQNFLIDEEVVNKIIENSEISKSDLVIEIGPGLGTLTSKLLEKAGKVIAIALDKNFLQICDAIRKRFDRCMITNSDILHGCVWRINLEDIDKIEFLKDKSYRYGSLNYIRSNGKRIDWQKDFYKKLK